MKKSSLIVLFMLSINCHSQFFDLSGATWIFDKQEVELFDARGYTRYSVEGDTTINLHMMHTIKVSEFSYDGGVKKLDDIYLYVNDSIIYRYSDEELLLIFDFSLNPGDTLDYNIFKTFSCDSVTPVILDSIGSLAIGQKNLIVQYFSYYERFFPEDALTRVSISVTENIGTKGKFFAWNLCSSEGSPVSSSIRCYHDQDIDYVAQWWLDRYLGIECDALINESSVNETLINSSCNVYPSLMSDILYIKTENEDFNTTLFDSLGRIVIQQKNSTSIDVSPLPKGLYFIQLNTNNQPLGSFKLLKQ